MHSAISSSDTKVDAIYISCPELAIVEYQSRFLLECTSLFTTCNENNNVKIIILEYNTLFDLDIIKSLKQTFETKYKWKTSSTLAQFTQFNDAIDNSLGITIMFNSTLVSPSTKINLGIARPPKIHKGFNEYIHSDFNRLEFSVSSFPSNDTATTDTYVGRIIKNVHDVKTTCRAIATIHKYDDPEQVPTLQGSFIYDSHYPAPPLSAENDNIFSQLLGIIYKAENNRLYTIPISFYEYYSAFGTKNEVHRHFVQTVSNISLLKYAMPAKTAAAILSQVSNILQSVTKEHQQYSLSQIPNVAPAAMSNVLLNSIICHKMPDNNT